MSIDIQIAHDLATKADVEAAVRRIETQMLALLEELKRLTPSKRRPLPATERAARGQKRRGRR